MSSADKADVEMPEVEGATGGKASDDTGLASLDALQRASSVRYDPSLDETNIGVRSLCYVRERENLIKQTACVRCRPLLLPLTCAHSS